MNICPDCGELLSVEFFWSDWKLFTRVSCAACGWCVTPLIAECDSSEKETRPAGANHTSRASAKGG